MNHPDGVYEFDLEGRFQRGNAALEQITGYPEQALVGRHFNEFIAPDYRELTQAAFDAARDGASRQYETLGTHADGHSFPLEVTNFPVTVDDEIVGVYGICHDITQRKRQEAQITYQATHDLLTGLPNRTALDDRLEQDLRWSQQNRRLLTVMYLDLDGFKAINDCLGYHVGNQLLVAIADRLRQLLGPRDFLARLTGDEFAFLVPNVTTREEVASAAERILAALGHSFEIDGRACTSVPASGSPAATRRSSRPTSCCSMPTWRWRSRIGRGTTPGSGTRDRGRGTPASTCCCVMILRDNQFQLYYQPIVDAVSGRIRSVEALVRWHHPTHGTVSPGVFVPIAEQTGQIIPLGRWVLQQACQSLAEMRAKGERVFPVAVNISSLEFRRDGFLDEVQGILDETGAAA